MTMLNQAKLNKISTALRNKNAIGKSALAATALLSLLGSPAFAAEENNNNAAEEVEVIEVKGMRGTMSRSLNIKKNTAAITDGISAADFGELPGLSVSDVIENITSVSGHRGKGSSSETSIRGMGPFLGYATFNGRTVTSAGYSRAVNFKKFPSELVNDVLVYKSQQADITEGGVAGTINIDSLRALDYGEEVTSIELGAIYNSHSAHLDDNNGLGNKVTASLVRQFETENLGDIGFTFGYQRTDSANPEESMLTSSTMYACATHLADGTPVNDVDDCEDNYPGTNLGITGDNLGDYQEGKVFLTPSSWTYRNMEEEDFREAVVTTLQWQPNDEWDINLDVEYSDNHYSENRHDFIVTSARRNLQNHVIDENMNLLYREGIAKFETQGYYRTEDESYNGFGLEVKHYITDDLVITGDLSYSKSHRDRTSFKSRINSGVYGNYSLDTREHRLAELKFLDADFNAVGDAGYDATTAFEPTNPESWVGGEGKYEREVEERINRVNAAKVDIEYAVDGDFFTSLKAGVRYSEASLWSDLDDDVGIDPATGEELPEYKTKDATEVGLLIENCFVEWNNPEWLSSESGAGLQGGQFAQFDAKCGYGSLSQANEDRSFVDLGPRKDRRSTGDVNVEEDTLAIYGMANFESQLFGLPVSGNFGVRIIRTDVESLGYLNEYKINSTVDPTDSDLITYELDIVQDAEGNNVLTTNIQKHDVTTVLPSANITFHYSEEFLIRTAAYRAMSRPQLLDMSAGRVIKQSDTSEEITDPNELISEVSGGNPYLEPLMSNNFDVSFEWYPSLDTAVSLAFYGKQFEANFKSIVEQEDLVIDGQSISVDLVTNTYTDDPAYLRGFELAAQHHFTDLPAPFDGLGMKASYNYANSSFKNEDGRFGNMYDANGDLEIPAFENVAAANLFGFSKNVFSGSIYWEGDDVSFRVLYKTRSKYYQPNSGAAANRYVEPFEYLDFNAKYKFSKNTSISFKALNVLDEAQYMTRSIDKTPTLISSTGPKYFLSLKHKF
ncbi:TonB-dependent receptor [Thalassotalea agariperforans]